MVKGVRHHVLVHVIAQIAVKPGADVFVNRLQLDEHQRQAVDETHQVSAAVVVGRAQARELEFAHHQKTVVGRVAKVDHPGLRVAQLTLRILEAHRHAIAHQLVKGLVVLQERARKIVVRQLRHRVFDGGWRQLRVEPGQRLAQVAHQHRLALTAAPQRAGGAKALLVKGIDAVPAQLTLQVLGKRSLHQAVFTVDVGVGHGVYWLFIKDKSLDLNLRKSIQINNLTISINPKGLCLFMIPPVLSFRNPAHPSDY